MRHVTLTLWQTPYLQVRSESLKSSVDSALHQIDEQISGLEGDNNRAALLSQLQDRRAQIQLTSTTGGRVMSEAQVLLLPRLLAR